MSQPIASSSRQPFTLAPAHSQPALSSTNSSPPVMTPSSTPPSQSADHVQQHLREMQMQHLLASFEAGTHQFCRESRESDKERRASFGFERGMSPTQPPNRRPSFLSGLSLSRPSFFTPISQPSSGASTPAAQTPHTGTFPASSSSSLAISALQDDDLEASAPARPDFRGRTKSIPAVPPPKHELEPGQMSRAKTTSNIQLRKGSAFSFGGLMMSGGGKEHDVAAAAAAQKQYQQEKMSEKDVEARHFDPSKEPRLLGLL